MEPLNWFHEGLRFQCTGCGACCTGTPGYVFLSPTDLARLAEHFGLTEEQFTATYTRSVDGGVALIDQNAAGDCVFLHEKRCTAYDARPTQCRTFPWWVQHLRTPEEWAEAKTRCEGIDHPDAPKISALEIEVARATYLDNLIEQNFCFNE